MNLEQTIHAYWADSESLESVLSADRLTTGRTSDGSPPYATLHLKKIRSQFPTNLGPAAKEIAFSINVWHDAYNTTKTIAEQIVETFDGASLELVDSSCVARVRHTIDSIQQHTDGRWRWSISFVASVCLL